MNNTNSINNNSNINNFQIINNNENNNNVNNNNVNNNNVNNNNVNNNNVNNNNVNNNNVNNNSYFNLGVDDDVLIEEQNKKKKSGNIPVDYDSEIPHVERWNSASTKAPKSAINGGLFGGEQAEGPYASIPVIPTATNMIHNNLLSANPPPGANVQYIGTNRSKNNYVAMPGVYWYSDTHPVNKGPYSIKVVEE